jgi:hypothetical protein
MLAMTTNGWPRRGGGAGRRDGGGDGLIASLLADELFVQSDLRCCVPWLVAAC